MISAAQASVMTDANAASDRLALHAAQAAKIKANVERAERAVDYEVARSRPPKSASVYVGVTGDCFVATESLNQIRANLAAAGFVPPDSLKDIETRRTFGSSDVYLQVDWSKPNGEAKVSVAPMTFGCNPVNSAP